MTRQHWAVALSLGASLFCVGLILASNMGFKIVHALKAADGVESQTAQKGTTGTTSPLQLGEGYLVRVSGAVDSHYWVIEGERHG